MENLKELISIIRKQKLKKIEIIGGPGTYNSKLQELFDGIHNGDFTTEEEAAAKLYGKDPDFINYKKLKYRLQKRLINTLFFIDKPSSTDHGKAYHACLKGQSSVHILITQGARKTAIEIARQVLRVAVKYELTSIIINLCIILCRHYGGLMGDKKRFEEYNTLLNKNIKLLELETLAEEYNNRLGMHFAKSRSARVDLEAIAIQYQEDLKERTKNFDSFQLASSKYSVYSIRYQVVNDVENMVKVCEEAVHYFDQKPFKTSKSFAFLFNMLLAYIPLKQFKKGELVAQRCFDFLSTNRTSLNWFFTLEVYIILAFYSEDYQKALSIYESKMKDVKEAKKTIRLKENWKIYEAYVQYFILLKKCHPSDNSPLNGKTFKVSKFLNDVPVFSSDKRGVNVSILIIQVLFSLQRKDYDAIIDRVEALDAYCYRYLKKDETFRSNCFIKMLLELPKSGFHKQAVIRKTAKYLKILQESSQNPQNLFVLVEIVPYENLWEFVLERLEDKHIKKFTS